MFFFKKILKKSEYLVGIFIFLVNKKAICIFLAKYNYIKLKLQKIIYIIKVLTLLFNII